MAWPWHNPAIRCAELNLMSESMWRKRSRSPFDQVTISHLDGQYVATRHGNPKEYRFEKYRACEKWVLAFYDGLLYGSGAPDDIFLDSLNSVSKKSHHKDPDNNTGIPRSDRAVLAFGKGGR